MSIYLGLRGNPNFTPAPGTYDKSQTITITHKNKVPVRYTIDGATPSCTVGEIYDEEKKISLVQGKFPLQAVECFEGAFSSSLGRGDYDITGGISITPPAGTYTTTQNVAVTQINSIPLRYTLDGTTPSCTNGTVFTGTAINLPLGKYTLQLAECVDSKVLNLTTAVYNITGTFSYPEILNGNLYFAIGSTQTYTPTGLDSSVVYSFTVSPALPSCLALNATTGVLTGTCSATQTLTSYAFTATRQDANKGDLLLSTSILIGQWTHEAYLKAPNAEAGDNFGESVSISGDTIVVGARLEGSNQTTITNGTLASSNNSAPSSGAAYVFRRTGTTWANEAYLKAPNAETIDTFGVSLAISEDTIVVGAVNEDSSQTTITNGTLAISNNSALSSGAAYVFRRTGTTWVNEAYVKAPNPDQNDFLGNVVSISGDTIVAGAPNEDSAQTTITNGNTAASDNTSTTSNQGAAYVFRRTGTTWANEAYLKAPNAEGSAGMSDNFGTSVSISGDTIVVGATGEDSSQNTITNGTLVQASDKALATNQGAAYVFRRTGTTWANEAYLKAPNPDSGDNFGYSVSISGDTIVVGASLEDSNQTTIANGSTSAGNGSSASGAAYVFRRSGNTWANEAYLKAPNAEANDEFGYSVSISGNTIVVGARFEDSLQATITNGTLVQSTDTGGNNVGAAYVFRRTGNIWSNETYLKAPNADLTDQFGSSVSISGDTIVVGAINEDSSQTTITNGTTAASDNTPNNTANQGAAYVFRLK